jgi:hypothetical protein
MNHELAERVFQRIEDDPASFDMRNWGRRGECDTTMCVAGHTVVEAGYQVHWNTDDKATLCTYTDSGRTHFIYHAAMVELGLTQAQALVLFYNDWEVQDLRQAWKDLAEVQ